MYLCNSLKDMSVAISSCVP